MTDSNRFDDSLKSGGNFIAHYGKLGQKWGVRNDESKTRIARGNSKKKRKNIQKDLIKEHLGPNVTKITTPHEMTTLDALRYLMDSKKLKILTDTSDGDSPFNRSINELDLEDLEKILIKESKKLKHSDEWLSHAGVLGMKWGVRNAESAARIARGKRSKKKKQDRVDRKTQEKQNRKDNSFTNNRQNRSMSDAELKKRIDRLELEKKYAQLTNPQQQKAESFLKDVAKQATKQVLIGTITDVGGAYLKQYAKVNINKKVPIQYQINLGKKKD